MTHLSARQAGGKVIMANPQGTVVAVLEPRKAREWGEDFARWPTREHKRLGRDILRLAGLAEAITETRQT